MRTAGSCSGRPALLSQLDISISVTCGHCVEASGGDRVSPRPAVRPMGSVLREGRTTLYDILGVARTATPREIKAQFYRLCLLYHPDRAAAEGPQAAAWRTAKFQQISQAYAVLSRDRERQAYDQSLGGPAAVAGGGGGSSWRSVGRRTAPRHTTPSWSPRWTPPRDAHRTAEARWEQHMRRWEILGRDSVQGRAALGQLRDASRADQRHDRQASRNRWLALALTVALYLLYSGRH